MFYFKYPIILFLSLSLSAFATIAAEQGQPQKTCDLSSSVKYRFYSFHLNSKSPIRAHTLEVDLKDAKTYIRPISKGCTNTSTLASRSGALAAVNGGFFGWSRERGCYPVSMLKIDGQVKGHNDHTRSVFGIDQSERVFIEAIAPHDSWSRVLHAVGGLPRIISNGHVDIRPEGHGGPFDDLVKKRHPRTAVGIMNNGHILFVTVDGRLRSSVGMNLNELARFMISLGVKDAVNLDGGGSSAFWIKPRGIVNTPNGGRGERAVNSALGVFAPPSGNGCF